MPSTRREFLKQAGTVAAVASIARPVLGEDAKSNPAGSNERFTVGVIGPGGQGTSVMNAMLETGQVSIAYLCDVDQNRLDAAAAWVEEKAGSGQTPKLERDMRRVLDDKDVDAVV